MDINWSKIVLSEPFFHRLESMVRRSIVDETTADEAITYILHCLSENNWEKCRAFTGKSAPDTYLYSLSSNLIIDYARKVYGRQRPPAWLTQKGDIWLAIWKELCLDRQATEFIINRHTANGLRDRDAIDIIIRAIKAKLPWCGVSIRPESLDDENVHGLPDQLVTDEDDIDERMAFEQALQFAHLLLNDSDHPASPLQTTPSDSIYAAVRAIELSPEDLLLLKMYFCDGLSGSAIASALGMAKHQPVRLIQKILEKARTQLMSIRVDLTPV